MKFKYILNEGMSETTRLKKIELTKTKITRVEAQVEKAQKNLDNLEAKIERDVIKPAKFLGLDGNDILNKGISDRYYRVEKDENYLKLVYRITDVSKYGLSLKDVLDRYDTRKNDFADRFGDGYFPDKNMYSTVSAQWVMFEILRQDPKLKKYWKACLALETLDYEKYNKTVLQSILDKKKAELEALNTDLTNLENLETKDAIVKRGFEKDLFVKPDVKDDVIRKVYKTVTDYYEKGLVSLKDDVKRAKKNYDSFDMDDIKDEILRYNDENSNISRESLEKLFSKEFKLRVYKGYRGYSLYVNNYYTVKIDETEYPELYDFAITQQRYEVAQANLDGFEDMYGTEEKRMKEARVISDDLFVRVYKEIGTMIDANNLEINNKGGLDGIVDGENGRARVTTIGAGGYNIQRYHYRTTIRKI
jgi:hypothetical protein